jgi:ATP sulfurylase
MNKNIVKKIVTVGPSSLKEDCIKKMDQLGVDIFRINLSHTKIEHLEQLALQLKSWTQKPICFDTEGAQLRTGDIHGQFNNLSANQLINLVPSNSEINPNDISLNLDEAFHLLRQGDILKIDFNGLTLQIFDVTNNRITARVLISGTVKSNKGIGIDRNIYLTPFTKKDLLAFEIAKKIGIKDFALSFTSAEDDIYKLRSFFDYPINVISKIESRIGLENLEGILKQANSILIDRGDLSRDVPIERIIYAQRYILESAKKIKTPVYIATNLMESMIGSPNPTRAEIHDIVSSLDNGALGLVLAAETAIGQYPVECVSSLSRIIDNYQSYQARKGMEFLDDEFDQSLITPHGGKLIQQYFHGDLNKLIENTKTFVVSDELVSDVVQICAGTYSPVVGFMNLNEIDDVLVNNKYRNVVWTLPILFQINEDQIDLLKSKDNTILLKTSLGVTFASFKIQNIESLHNIEEIAEKWFGTTDKMHPGVSSFLKRGNYVVSGSPFLINKPTQNPTTQYELLPKQARALFREMGWRKIVGFHTRNVGHGAHEFIQKLALKRAQADGLFISPVVGIKKKGDFNGDVVLKCYEKMISADRYFPYGAILGAFNTFSRYSGPREAVFTAICRKNYGCSDFIVGRDHTGVGNYYEPLAAIKYLENFELGIKIHSFSTVDFCKKCNTYVETCPHEQNSKEVLSGTLLRDFLTKGANVPEYFIRPEVKNLLIELKDKNPQQIFV